MMGFPVLDIPDDPHLWAGWLESQLTGLELGELVDELQLLLDVPPVDLTLQEICGDELVRVLEQGLSVLGPEPLRGLLKHPRSLLDLQELILCEGGTYWTDRVDTPAARAASARQQAELIQRLRTVSVPAHRFFRRRNWMLFAGGLAAGIIFALRRPFVDDAWGWNRPGIFTVQLAATPFLQSLADHADEFFQRPCDNAAQMARQITDLRQGCETLQRASLTQLAEVDRVWLKERCRVWAAKFDDQLTELERSTRPWQQVRTDTETTVRTLTKALRERKVT